MKKYKSLGQHFLRDPQISQDMVARFINETPCKNVLEIGPGDGAITQFLLLHNDINYKIVELDERLVQLHHKDPQRNHIEIIHCDFLKLNLRSVFDGSPFSIIGNFPYNISSQIIFKILDTPQLVPYLVGMFQREFAMRVISNSGHKDYGIPSVLTQYHYDCHHWFDIAPNLFEPPPKVWSTIISLNLKQEIRSDIDLSIFKRIVKATFNQRRKMLRNTLRAVMNESQLKNPLIEKYLMLRPEQITLDDYMNIATICS